jgi:2-oxoglutarate dehydrogenase E2 component (dihydrolipoamide succinyltransferase)
LGELETIAGTGNEGRVTKKDILQYVSDRRVVLVTAQPKVMPSTPQVVYEKKGNAKVEVPLQEKAVVTDYSGANVR